MSVAGAGVPGGAAGAAIGAALLSTLERVEEDLDEKLAALDAPPEEDEVERLRAARLARLRRVAAEKAAWAAAGHGELRDVPDQKQFFEELKRVARFALFYREPTSAKQRAAAELAWAALAGIELCAEVDAAWRAAWMADAWRAVVNGRCDGTFFEIPEKGGACYYGGTPVSIAVSLHNMPIVRFLVLDCGCTCERCWEAVAPAARGSDALLKELYTATRNEGAHAASCAAGAQRACANCDARADRSARAAAPHVPRRATRDACRGAACARQSLRRCTLAAARLSRRCRLPCAPRSHARALFTLLRFALLAFLAIVRDYGGADD